MDQLQTAGEQLAESHPGGIDVLINNAGISGSRTRPIEQCAPFACSQASHTCNGVNCGGHHGCHLTLHATLGPSELRKREVFIVC